MNIISCLPFFLAALGGFLNGLFVIIRKNRNATQLAFSVVSFLFAIWALFIALTVVSINDSEFALFVSRVANYSSFLIPMFYLHFIYLLLEESKKRQFVIKIGYIINSSLFLICLVFFRLFIPSVSRKAHGFYIVDAGPLFHVFGAFFGIACLIFGIILLEKIKHTSGHKLDQLYYILLASMFGFVFGGFPFLSVYLKNFSILWSAPVVFFPFIVAYAVLKLQVMDIRLVISRVAVFITVYSIIIGVPFLVSLFGRSLLNDLLGPYWYYAPLTLNICFALAGPFLFIQLDRKIQERFLIQQKRFRGTIKQASSGIINFRDIRKISKFIVHILARALKIKYLAVYSLDENAKKYKLFFKRGFSEKMLSEIPEGHLLINFMKLKMFTMTLEELVNEVGALHMQSSDEIIRLMRELGGKVIIPCFPNGKLLTFLVLGGRKNEEAYTKEDVETLDILSKQTALAIENAMSYKQVEETQAQIFQAEKMATIGTMADGLSHQIKNRFNTMIMIVEYVEAILKKVASLEQIDAEEIKQVLKDAAYRLDSIKENALEGSEVVNGLLKYSRNTKSEFEALGIDAIIDKTVEMLAFKIKIGEINFLRLYPKDLPRIKGSIVQLQEVFFNLIDNAYDAIHERIKVFPEQNYVGTVQISASVIENGFLRVIVEDNGIGIKKEEQPKVFAPFYTTKIIGQKGTGLGLYVVNKVIVQNHNGKVAVSSEYGKGTKFSIELPLAQV